MAKQTKKEAQEKAIAKAVGAGQPLRLETVNFSEANRPPSCLEVDFPILPINSLAAVESTSGAARKPIYLATKWWARRPPSVFRALLLAAATKAPLEKSSAAAHVWKSFYGNHQDNPAFKSISVVDLFMGGGTTIIEGARLGMRMFGTDLNPVAWFVVKNELTSIGLDRVKSLLDHVEAVVHPQIKPFFACDCPRGHKGKWTKVVTGEVMDGSFDPLLLKSHERSGYQYSGPEVVYTFWAKHGPCQATECDHRTPLLTTPVIAKKELSVRAWSDLVCTCCENIFDVEHQDARIAPSASLVIAEGERPFSVVQDDKQFECPHCKSRYLVYSDTTGQAPSGRIISFGKPKGKTVSLTLLVHPEWLKGSPGKDASGKSFGGSVTDSSEATTRWHAFRSETLGLIEVRGDLPEMILCPNSGEEFFTDRRGGNLPKTSTFSCQESTCGLLQDVLTSVKKSGNSGPTSPYAIHGFCQECADEKRTYGGRFFSLPSFRLFSTANQEWEDRKEGDLAGFWPRSELPYGFMTHRNNGGLPNHGFTHWWTMFNARQLLIHSQLIKTISEWPDSLAAEVVLGIMPQVLRANCSLSFWHQLQDCIEPTLGSANFHPKPATVENCVFNDSVGRGTFTAYAKTLIEALDYREKPWDLALVESLKEIVDFENGPKTVKVANTDQVLSGQVIECGSATQLQTHENSSIDLVVTDPPFGGLMHYSELSDFFYVWLRIVLKNNYPLLFTSEYTPKALEVVANRARHGEDADTTYKRLLTASWQEAHRILKAGGILAFTFHHSDDEPWIAVLESLFDSGFYLEATYPIRSDDTKGEGGKPGTFGSQLIEFDIIHVCRKRMDEPKRVSWAKLRRQIMQDVGQLREILEQHQKAGLQGADLQVIRRGKALEYFSKHYGQVYVEEGRNFTVREALLAINQLLEDDTNIASESPPVLAEAYTRQFFRLFGDRLSLPRDQMQKYLRGTGVSPQEFIDRGWCEEKGKVFTPISPLEWAQSLRGIRRDAVSRDFDQVMFMVGACFANSGLKLTDTLNNPNFAPHPANSDLLDWLTRHGGNSMIKDAAKTALQLYRSWQVKNVKKVEEQRLLFDLSEEGA